MQWRRFVVTAPRPASEAICAIMQHLFGGLSIADTQDNLEHIGYMSLEADHEAAYQALLTALHRIPADLATPDRIAISSDIMDEQDWAEAWKQHYHPIRVTDRLVIVPPWRPWPDPDSELQPGPEDILIRIEPGMAFGTGNHATTRLCMEALQEYLQPAARVIDFGCGSGILTVTACQLGADTVLALDRDPMCVEVTSRNVAEIGLSGRCRVQLVEGLADVDEAADLIVANVTAEVVAAEAIHAARILSTAGRYIISGFTDRSIHELAAAIEAAGMAVVDTYEESEWCCWVATKRDAG